MPTRGLPLLAGRLRPAAAACPVTFISRALVQHALVGRSKSSTRGLSTHPTRSATRQISTAASALAALAAAGARSQRYFASSPPPSSRPASTSKADARQPASSYGSLGNAARSGPPATPSIRSRVTPASPVVATLPRRRRPPPNPRSSDVEEPPASDTAEQSTPRSILQLPSWLRWTISGAILVIVGLEWTLRSYVALAPRLISAALIRVARPSPPPLATCRAGRPSLLSYVPILDFGIERAIDRWFEPNPPPSREELLSREAAERRLAEGHFAEERPIAP
jgi:hypothetical protein